MPAFGYSVIHSLSAGFKGPGGETVDIDTTLPFLASTQAALKLEIRGYAYHEQIQGRHVAAEGPKAHCPSAAHS